MLKTFKSNQSLCRHQARHTKEKPYSCSKCKKTYMRGDTMKRHMKFCKKTSSDININEKTDTNDKNLINDIVWNDFDFSLVEPLETNNTDTKTGRDYPVDNILSFDELLDMNNSFLMVNDIFNEILI